MSQSLHLPLSAHSQHTDDNYRQKLKRLLSKDFNFHDKSSAEASHDFHAFPAKFPPQLPRLFIDGLTEPGDYVLDPMVGSGTTILEAYLAGRNGLGLDIDPMALRLSKVKVTSLDANTVLAIGTDIADRSLAALKNERQRLQRELSERFDKKTRDFVDYWFLPETQLELTALISEIECIEEKSIREFLHLVFSAIIITKSGGVSLARDLAHTRPHRDLTKVPRHAVQEYRKRLEKNVQSLAHLLDGQGAVSVVASNAEYLPLAPNTVDLLVTSPPYAAVAIDYMRAHKFSLVWLGHTISQLSTLRKKYVGGESISGFEFRHLPSNASKIVEKVEKADPKRALMLHRYFSEANVLLSEMLRVLKPGNAAIIVIGPSTMRGIDTQTQTCIGEIAESIGFDLIDIVQRQLDRNRRMLPASFGNQQGSQIEQRMHEEYIIALIKPDK